MANFKVKEVTEDKLHSLKEELTSDWARNFLIQSSIHLRLYLGELEKTKLRLYKAENPKFRSFIFMSPLFSEHNWRSMTVNWEPDYINNEEVGILLSNIPTWNWNEQFYFISCNYDTGIRFNDIFKKNLIIGNKTPMVECTLPCHRGLLMKLSKEHLQKPAVRNEKRYSFGLLPSSAASLMHSTWEYNFLESVEGIQERIDAFEGVGVFYKGENESDTLACWTHQYMFGAIGMTYTVPEHRNNGLAAAVTYELSKKILKVGRIPFVIISPDNSVSISYHKRIGFKYVSDVVVFLYAPEKVS